MKTIFDVQISTQKGIFNISLPQGKEDFEQFLIDAHILAGRRKEYKILSVTSDFHLLGASLHMAGNLEELNFIAQKMEAFDNTEASRFSDILAALGGGVHNAVNLANHYDSLLFYDGINDFYDLGSAYLLHHLQADAKDYSDFYVIEMGKFAQQEQGGVFIGSMYVGFPKEFFKEAYNGHILPYSEQQDNNTIYLTKIQSLPVLKPDANRLVRDDKCIDIKARVSVRLPASAVEISHALEKIGARSINDKVTVQYTHIRHGWAKALIRFQSRRLGEICDIAYRLNQLSDSQFALFNQKLNAADSKELKKSMTSSRYILPTIVEIVYGYDLFACVKSDYNTYNIDANHPIQIILEKADEEECRTLITFTGSRRESEPSSYDDGEYTVRAYSADGRTLLLESALTDCHTMEQIYKEIEKVYSPQGQDGSRQAPELSM